MVSWLPMTMVELKPGCYGSEGHADALRAHAHAHATASCRSRGFRVSGTTNLRIVPIPSFSYFKSNHQPTCLVQRSKLDLEIGMLSGEACACAAHMEFTVSE